jgi:hypothetical protein
MANSGFNFSVFVNELIENTMDAILVSQINQEKKILEIKEDLYLSDEELIGKYNLIEEAKNAFDTEPTEEELFTFIENYIDDHKTMIKDFVDKGIAKLVVDKGKLSIKGVISIEDTDVDAEKENTETDIQRYSRLKAPKKGVELRNIDIKTYKQTQQKLSKKVMDRKLIQSFRMDKAPNIKIKPVKDNDATNEGTVDIVSEISLEFRTVIV